MLLTQTQGTHNETRNKAAVKADNRNKKWCEKNYVEAKDCEKWVADQMARKEARKADEKARKADEEGRATTHEAKKYSRKTAPDAQKDNRSSPQVTPMLLTQTQGTHNETRNKAASKADNRNKKWCEKNYVDAKDCEKWVADQMARKESRKADEKARKVAREA